MTQFEHFTRQLRQLAEQQRLRRLVPRSIDGVHLVDDDGRRLINFGGNDYLGLASGDRDFHGAPGSGASALVCGWTAAHQRLADLIAEFESTESAVLFPSGYAACSGTVATLAQAGDLVLSDQLNHASLIDGCRLSKAERVVYPHRDVDFVEATLESRRREFDRAWIITDGVFSMDGHVAPLRDLCDIAVRYDATMVVDEAHGTGVLGPSGCGACEALDVRDRVAIRIGTLSKAIGSQGGFVAGPREVIEILVNRCRSLIYSTSLAPAAVAAASDSFAAIRSESERRERVREFARSVRRGLSIDADPIEAGVPIVPYVLGDDKRALAAAASLTAEGFYVPAIRPPTVPEGSARLRISLSAAHEPAMVESLIEAVKRLG